RPSGAWLRPQQPRGQQLAEGGQQRRGRGGPAAVRALGRPAAERPTGRAGAVVSVLAVRGALHHPGAPALPVLAVAADAVRWPDRRGASGVRDPVVLALIPSGDRRADVRLLSPVSCLLG